MSVRITPLLLLCVADWRVGRGFPLEFPPWRSLEYKVLTHNHHRRIYSHAVHIKAFVQTISIRHFLLKLSQVLERLTYYGKTHYLL